MRRKLASNECKMVVQLFFERNKSASATVRAFNTWAANSDIQTRVNRKNVIDVVKRFTVNDFLCQRPKPERYKKTTDEENLNGVLSSLFQQPGGSLRRCAEEMQLSYGTTQTIARHVLKLYPYRLCLAQKLSDHDKFVRIEAGRRLLDVITPEKKIVFSDECTFYTDGHVNRWNCVIWDYERPENFIAERSQSARSLTVWAGISTDNVFGPYFFPYTVTGEDYQAVLSEFFLPDLLHQVADIGHVWFQQDGAPAHVAKDTKQLLMSNFQGRIISRDFEHEWPPRSPDLTPCDYFLWGVVKEEVYKNGAFTSVTEMADAIIRAFAVIRNEKMNQVRNAVLAVPRRMEECMRLGGYQLLHC